MRDKNDNLLDRAEGFARRVLERLGSTFEGRPGTEADGATLSHSEISDLTARIEREIESNLRKNSNGVKQIAPNRIRVGFTYERATKMNKDYLDALTRELKSTTFEYITNRRYSTLAPLAFTAEPDLFAKSTVIKVDFDETSGVESPAGGSSASPAAGPRALSLRNASGRTFQLSLSPGGAPATIGRTASNAVHIDDPDVSRIHCSLAQKSSGEIVIADLGSANGTTVNGLPLAPSEARALNKGDVIGVGDLRLTIVEMD